MRVLFYRILAVLLPVAILEILCRDHLIPPLTLPAPSLIALGLLGILAHGSFNAAIIKTLANVGLAIALAVTVGTLAGAALHRVR